MIGISAHDKRVLAAGAAILAAILGGSKVAAQMMEWSRTVRTSAASLVIELARQDVSIRTLARTRDSLVARRVRLANADSSVLDGDTPVLAAASLVESVSDLADATTVQVGNVQLRTDSLARGAFVAVQIQASVTGDAPAVMRFLAKLESGPKLIALREVGINVQGDQSAQGKREVLRADVVIEGLARNPAPHPVAKR